jgi:hypothetical protein
MQLASLATYKALLQAGGYLPSSIDRLLEMLLQPYPD